MGYREDAEFFEKNETAFHLGFLPTEQSSPLTRTLDRKFAASSAEGVRNLQSVDRNVWQMAERVFQSREFAALVDQGRATVAGGGRIVFSGCGATGRLSILLEAIWREGCSREQVRGYRDSVASIMTGGDYALVKSVESFEDYAIFGARQVADMRLNAHDMLVAITEGGETSSVLGTVAESVKRGARVFLLFNNPADLLAAKLERCREAIQNPGVIVLDLSCGPMALAGSTRMQATTSEQLIASAALEMIFRRLENPEAETPDFAAGFDALLYSLEADGAVAAIAGQIDCECEVYRAGGRVTYYADESMLDIFTDTTERSPTFMLPAYKPADDVVSPEPWALARNPLYPASMALSAALGGRAPRCLAWSADDYRQMGAPARLIADPPRIDSAMLAKFPIGREPLPSRSATGKDLAVLFGFGAVSETMRASFARESVAFAGQREWLVGSAAFPVFCVPTRLRIFERLAVKLALNTMSTGTMAKFGRVAGNWMSFVAVSNKKLIDRAIRLIAELGEVDYHTACEALFRAKEELAALPPDRERPSAVQYTLAQLKEKRG